MVRFVRFYKEHGGRVMEALGSDGVMPLDGRLGLDRCKQAAREQAARLKAVKPDLVAFQIMAGTYGNARPITGRIALKESIR